MILVNKEEKSAQEVAEMFGINYGKIMAAPVFLTNPENIVQKAGQSKEISSKAGIRPQARFTVKWQGKNMEIRYAETVNERIVGERVVPEYTPHRVPFMGEMLIVSEGNDDLAMFFYLHPFNENSPFRKKDQKFEWYFKDLEAEGERMMEVNDALMDAMVAIRDMRGEPLRVMAKGMNIAADSHIPDTNIKAQLINMAKADPVKFNESINSQVVQFRGLIINGVDTGLFEAKIYGGGERWIWAQGDRKGQTIVELINNGANKVEVLIEAILLKIQEYYPILVSAYHAITSVRTAESYLEQNKIDLQDIFKGAPEEVYREQKAPESEFGGGSEEVSEEPVGDFDLGNDNEDLDLGGEGDEDLDLTEPGDDLSAAMPSNVTEEEVYVPDFLKEKPAAQKGGRRKSS